MYHANTRCVRGGGLWEVSVASAAFFWRSKTALKIKSIKINPKLKDSPLTLLLKALWLSVCACT